MNLIQFFYWTSLIIIITICLWKWIEQRLFCSKRYPSGPAGLPVVGFLPFLGLKPHEKLQKLAQKYGNIFRQILIFIVFIVFISRYKLNF